MWKVLQDNGVDDIQLTTLLFIENARGYNIVEYFVKEQGQQKERKREEQTDKQKHTHTPTLKTHEALPSVFVRKWLLWKLLQCVCVWERRDVQVRYVVLVQHSTSRYLFLFTFELSKDHHRNRVQSLLFLGQKRCAKKRDSCARRVDDVKIILIDNTESYTHTHTESATARSRSRCQTPCEDEEKDCCCQPQRTICVRSNSYGAMRYINAAATVRVRVRKSQTNSRTFGLVKRAYV